MIDLTWTATNRHPGKAEKITRQHGTCSWFIPKSEKSF